MRKDEAVQFFGSQAELARAIRQTPNSVERWGDLIPNCRRNAVREAMKLRAEELAREAKRLCQSDGGRDE